MEWKKIVAIIRRDKLRDVQERLKDLRMVFINSTQRKGYGEYTNLFSPDWSMTYARLEIYCETARAEEIVQAIMDIAHTGLAGDGIVVLIPVEKLYRIRLKAEAEYEEA
jgi:nitrogen regulatory protein P-II 1